MGWAQPGGSSTPHGIIWSHSQVCSPVGLAGADGLAGVSDGVCWPSAGPLAPRASHPAVCRYVRVKCTKRAKPSLEVMTSLLQGSAGQGSPKASSDARGAPEQQRQTAKRCGTTRFSGTVTVTIHPRVQSTSLKSYLSLRPQLHLP